MAKITSIAVDRCSDTYISVVADMDKGDSVSYRFQLIDMIGYESYVGVLSIRDIKEMAEWIKGYCSSRQSISTISTMLFKSLLKKHL